MNEQQFVPTPAPMECDICHTKKVYYLKVPMFVDKDVIVISCNYCNKSTSFTIVHNVNDEVF